MSEPAKQPTSRYAKPLYSMALDLGQLQDYSTPAIIEATGTVYQQDDDDPDIEWDLPAKMRGDLDEIVGPPVTLNLRWLERYPLGTSYPNIVRLANDLFKKVPEDRLLSLDATGVGVAVVDMFQEAGLETINISITGGDHVTVDEPFDFGVPKRDLVHGLLIAMQQGRFHIAAKLPFSQELISEMTNFRVKINSKTGHDTYEAWRNSEHDDLVLAVSIAVWVAERKIAADCDAEIGRRKAAAMERMIRQRISPL